MFAIAHANRTAIKVNSLHYNCDVDANPEERKPRAGALHWTLSIRRSMHDFWPRRDDWFFSHLCQSVGTSANRVRAAAFAFTFHCIGISQCERANRRQAFAPHIRAVLMNTLGPRCVVKDKCANLFVDVVVVVAS